MHFGIGTSTLLQSPRAIGPSQLLTKYYSWHPSQIDSRAATRSTLLSTVVTTAKYVPTRTSFAFELSRRRYPKETDHRSKSNSTSQVPPGEMAKDYDIRKIDLPRKRSRKVRDSACKNSCCLAYTACQTQTRDTWIKILINEPCNIEG